MRPVLHISTRLFTTSAKRALALSEPHPLPLVYREFEDEDDDEHEEECPISEFRFNPRWSGRPAPGRSRARTHDLAELK